VSFGYPVDAVILAEASGHVVVTVEEIVDRIDERDAVGTFLPSILVDAVAHAPLGAHPGGLVGRYGPDQSAMREYVAAARTDAEFAEYLQRTVFEPASHDEYLERFAPRAGANAVRA
jgi:glutaconate CoA-transferase subunit A